MFFYTCLSNSLFALKVGFQISVGLSLLPEFFFALRKPCFFFFYSFFPVVVFSSFFSNCFSGFFRTIFCSSRIFLCTFRFYNGCSSRPSKNSFCSSRIKICSYFTSNFCFSSCFRVFFVLFYSFLALFFSSDVFQILLKLSTALYLTIVISQILVETCIILSRIFFNCSFFVLPTFFFF